MIGKIHVENINVLGYTHNVNKVKYLAMKEVLLKVVPKHKTGITQKEMLVMIQSHLPQDLFSNGEKSAWWMKTAQLDLKAKSIIKRNLGKPLTWYQL